MGEYWVWIAVAAAVTGILLAACAVAIAYRLAKGVANTMPWKG